MAFQDSNAGAAGMNPTEIRASVSLASIFALRMLGLFLILPVFAEYAKTLPGGGNATLVGLAMGIYGLAQALCQLPLGMASDRFGRKPVIIAGLILFALGAALAALATDLLWVTIGRAVQGAGAISAAITALIADCTREQHRTKAMAMVGGSIGITFAVSLIGAPGLYHWIGMPGIFALTGVLAIVAIAVVLFVVPAAPRAAKARQAGLAAVLADRELMRLNLGVFVLHVAQVSVFVVVPSALVQATHLPVALHWKIYLPVVLGSFVLMLPPIFIGEKRGKIKHVFLGAIALLLAVQLGFAFDLWAGAGSGWLLALLLGFFIAFNILEASQPSLVSRYAPPHAKGAALGVYNTLQSLGLFCGGLVGGWLKQHAGAGSVFVFGAGLTTVWLIMAANMQSLPRRSQAQAAVV